MPAMRRKQALDDKNSIASQIYDRIKSDIVELRLEPGAYFLEKEIAESLGASRTPVREAAKRLEQEGWIFWESYRKARVKDVSLESAMEIFQLRNMIEPFCINWVFDHGNPRVLAGKLATHFAEMERLHNDWVRFLHADVGFHTAIVEEVGNIHLQRIWLNLSSEITRIGIWGKTEERNVDDVEREHREMLQGLWDVDREKILTCLATHHEGIFASLSRKLQRR